MADALTPFATTSTPPALPNLTTRAGQLEMIRREIQRLRTVTGTHLVQAYATLRKIVYQTPGFTSDEIYEHLGDALASRLGMEAVLIKSLLNTLNPGAVVDAVPEATITMPG